MPNPIDRQNPHASRRDFCKQSGALLACSLLPVTALSMQSPKPASRYKIGLQLFTVRDAMDADPIDTLKRLKAMGYEDFEIYGFDPERLSYYGIEAGEFKTVLDDMGLSVSSGHYPLSEFFNAEPDALKKYIDACILGAHAAGMRYITWPWLHPDYRNLEGFKKLTGLLSRIGEQVVAGGLGFAYHNHGYEFSDLGGTSGYDLILSETDPETVKLQLDLYWTAHEGIGDPSSLFESHPGRFVMWHIKDMHKTSRDYTELGNGSIDYTPIMPMAAQAGMQYYYLEQGGNFASNSMQSVADSLTYFKEHYLNLLP